MTRTEYFTKQRELSKSIARAEVEAARRIRKKTREYILPLVKEYAETLNIIYPVEQLAHDITAIILEEAAKPVAAVRKLQDDMEASIAEKLSVKLHRRPEPLENARQRRLENAREPVGTIIKTPGRGWGYGTSGLAAYHRDPQTGKVVWDDLPLEYQFRKRADLSEQVWKAVEEQEQMVFDVIRGGRAAGRNVKEVCGDLETFINYQDGGDRVVGRWGKMFPNTEEGRREAWKREYLTAHGGLQPGSDAAKALLRQPDAQAWVKQKMDETTKRGTPRLPSAVRSYATRLGKAGLDHRAIRIARTETTAMVADEQLAIAENSDICTGEMDFVMERGRDHWNCNCEKYAEQNPWQIDDPERPEIPVHPNCMCEWRPRLRTDEEILALLREEMKEDLETIEGTDEQREMLERFTEEDTEIGTPSERQPLADGENILKADFDLKTKAYNEINNEYQEANREFDELEEYIKENMFAANIDEKKERWYELGDKLQEYEPLLHDAQIEQIAARDAYYGSQIRSIDDFEKLIKEKGEGFAAEIARGNLRDVSSWYDSLTRDEKESLVLYSENTGYRTINGILYGKENDSAIIKAWQNDIDNVTSVLGRYETGMDMVVYRNTSPEFFEGLNVGDSYTSNGFVSTAVGKNDRFSNVDEEKNLLIEIKVPRGTHGIWMDGNTGTRAEISRHTGEDEFLIQRGTAFRIIERSKNRMVVEIVGQR